MELDSFYKLFISQRLNYTTDSRKISRGCIFFALKGEHFNGNDFAMQALKEGASHAVVDENVGNDLKLIKVDNVLKFFQETANMQRRAYDIPIIAVAGSNGKTSTKELIHAVLSQGYKTHMTAGNFNNHIGVPITLLDMPQDAEMAIVEIGTNHPGEIEALCKIVEPTHGIITNIGKEHLEGFGNLEAVAKEESELYRYLQMNNGQAFVNAEDEWLVRMSRALENRILFDRLELKHIQLLPTIRFEFNGHKVSSSLMGAHNLENILAALAIGQHFGIADDKIAAAVSAYRPANNRSEWLQKGSNSILLDAYNANPSSMMKAIESIADHPSANKVLILGDMFEMGAQAAAEHAALLQFCVDLKFKEVFLLGSEFQKQAKEFEFHSFESMEQLQNAIMQRGFHNTLFLVKGSRGMKMEAVLEAFD